MMRRLIARRPLDAFGNQPRAFRQNMIRWLYLASVLWLAIWLGDIFFGGLFYLRSEGLVVGEPAVVAAEFPVTIRDLKVKEGDRVEAGSVVAVATSQNVMEAVARLTSDVAVRETRLSELRIREKTIAAIIGLAESGQTAAADARGEYEKLLDRGLLPLDKRTATLESEFRNRQNFESLKAERQATENEIAFLTQAFTESKNALNDLRRLYDDGKMRAPVTGVVTRIAADKGAVVRSGDALMEIQGDHHHVLAYLPTGALYNIAPGVRVHMISGLLIYNGIVARVEPVAAVLPREFQKAFKPTERQQMFRVEFDTDGPPLPPLFSKINLHSEDFFPRWAPARLHSAIHEMPIWLMLFFGFAGIGLATYLLTKRASGFRLDRNN